MRLLLTGSLHSAATWTEALAPHGVVIAIAGDAQEALRELRSQAAVGVIIVDDGAGLAHRRIGQLHGSGTGVVIVVSDSTRALERAVWLNDGADDVIASHCDAAELLARVQSIQRRGNRHESVRLCVGEAELDVTSRCLVVAGQSFDLTRMEFALLRLMFLRKGAVMDKAALVEHLHQQGHESDPRSIDVLVCKLRKKLGDHGWLIGTVWGSGYRLQLRQQKPRAA